MKLDYPGLTKEVLCRLFGKTRHALYDHLWRTEEVTVKEEIILQLVHAIRIKLPRVGARKLLFLLQPALLAHHLHIGRDALFELLAEHKMLVRHRKRKVITTDSRHWMRKYSNLIKTLLIDRPEQVWVSDITYVRVKNEWGYLSLITDAYSRQIMGFAFRSDMLAQGCIHALEMAIATRMYPKQRLIHHSDRGSQYCCTGYVDVLNQHNIAISMTENGDPYENALAERMNGIIKNEFNLYNHPLNFQQTYQLICQSIQSYNTFRPHSSCDYMTPAQAHLHKQQIVKRWKSYPRSWEHHAEHKIETIL
jgi:putative transposase